MTASWTASGGDPALTTPLLSTKLFVPPPRPTLVPRPRLVTRLSEGLARPLTLVSAPAGSGKTTLVSDWCASTGRDVPLAWFSLDPADNDPALFLRYLVAALTILKPDLAAPDPSLLQSPQPTRQALLTNLINDLGQFPEPFVLVLDDLHLIVNDEVHAALAFLLDHLPPWMHLMLLTQVDPPLPLARLRARDQMVEIRAGDLRFTAGEAEAFFHQSMGLALSGDRVAALEQRTEGWIAGLQLAALTLQARRQMEGPVDDESIDAFLNAFTGSHPYVADYLVEEVLNRQSEPVRTFLLQTSILERMTGALCDHVTGLNNSQQLLKQLYDANLFMIPMDAEAAGKTGAGWYRYHHLFRDLLRSQLQETAGDTLAMLHRRAAEWYEQHGFVSEAITHALACGDQRKAAQIIEQNAMDRLMHGDSVTVLNWIDAVELLHEEHPWLGIYLSWAQLVTGEIELIEARLQLTESRLAERASDGAVLEMSNHIAALRALVAARSGRARQAITLAQQVLERLPEGETTIRSIITFILGDQSWSIGDLAQAQRVFAKASRMDRVGGSPFAALLALSSVGVLLTEQGELHRAEDAFQKVIQKVTQPNGRKQPVAAVACLGLAGLAYEWNNLDEAESYAQQALELGTRWGNPDTLANAHLVLARCQHARGSKADSLASLRQAEALARGPGVTLWSSLRIDAFRVRLWLAQGHLDAAERWVRQQGVHPEDEITYPRQIGYLTLARVLGAQHNTDEAITLLERLRIPLEANEQMGRILELLLIQALILSAQGDTASAFAALTRALSLGEQEGYLRMFVDEGEPMAALLRNAGSHGIAPKYVARLLSAFGGGAGPATASQQPLIEPLSDRELEVLRLIAEGLSNQAIAERLVIALGTVKTHTASLYRKLDVTSRTQAVARATELGLL